LDNVVKTDLQRKYHIKIHAFTQIKKKQKDVKNIGIFIKVLFCSVLQLTSIRGFATP